MGPALVSYSDKAQAEALAEERGGRVISFAQINLEVLQEIAQISHEMAAEHGDQMQMMHGHADTEEPEHSVGSEEQELSEQH